MLHKGKTKRRRGRKRLRGKLLQELWEEVDRKILAWKGKDGGKCHTILSRFTAVTVVKT